MNIRRTPGGRTQQRAEQQRAQRDEEQRQRDGICASLQAAETLATTLTARNSDDQTRQQIDTTLALIQEAKAQLEDPRRIFQPLNLSAQITIIHDRLREDSLAIALATGPLETVTSEAGRQQDRRPAEAPARQSPQEEPQQARPVGRGERHQGRRPAETPARQNIPEQPRQARPAGRGGRASHGRGETPAGQNVPQQPQQAGSARRGGRASCGRGACCRIS